jgi:PAS domain S-box-containing protein
VTAPHAPFVNRLRRRLRGLPFATMIAALQESLETLEASALAADNTGRYVAANARATQLTGYSHRELLQMSVSDLTPAMRLDASGELWRRFIQAGAQSGDYELERRDGTCVSVHYAAYASVAPGVHLSVLTPLGMASPA